MLNQFALSRHGTAAQGQGRLYRRFYFILATSS
jgi:hypothetical protein